MKITPINNYTNQIQLRKMSEKLSSGKKIVRASHDAANLAIANKMRQQSNGLKTASYNIKDGINLQNIKDGALGSMQDSMQRVYELSIRASNGLYSDSDKKYLQDEINQQIEGIQQTAKTTKFNETYLMNGSKNNIHIASNADGSGIEMPMEDITTNSLGIQNYNVMQENFSFQSIEDAMDKLNFYRSQSGAITNGLEYSYNQNQTTSENLVASRSRIEDLDMAKEISQYKNMKIIEQYKTALLNKQLKFQQANAINLFL